MNFVNPQQKQINVNGLNINYKQIGNGDMPIVLLHGWGVDSEKYIETAKQLFIQTTSHKLQAKILIPDLPGFGKSEEPKEDWNLDDYVEFADKFIEKASRKSGFELVKNILKNIQNNSTIIKGILSQQNKKESQLKQYDSMYYHTADENQKKILKQSFDYAQDDIVQNDKKIKDDKAIILIGHSFGGRVAIKYAVKYPEKIDKLILTGAAGIRHKLNAKQKVFFTLSKLGKNIFSLPVVNKFQKYAQKILYKLAREKDYYQASLKMKEIMKNILAEDLAQYLSKIKTPTLLVWGKLDNSTPLSDGKIMNEKIENSELVIFDDTNHSLLYQKPEEFGEVVMGFIKNKI